LSAPSASQAIASILIKDITSIKCTVVRAYNKL